MTKFVFCAVSAVLLSGCGHSALPGATARPATTSHARSLDGATCSGVIAPNITITAGPSLGAYAGVTLPVNFNVCQNQGDVTARLANLRDDQSAGGRDAWTKFSCLFPAASYVFALVSNPVCPGTFATAQTSTGAKNEGIYAGLTLPAGWDTLGSQDAVQAKIDALKAAAIASGFPSPAAQNFVAFMCLYPAAIAKSGDGFIVSNGPVGPGR
jgi:hypothetical protein